MKEAHVALDTLRTKEAMCVAKQHLEELGSQYKALNSGELQRHSC